MNELFFVYNGEMVSASDTVAVSNCNALMYGDGLFETMRMHQGRILNLESHMERLIASCESVGYDLPAGLKNVSHYSRQLAAKQDMGPYVRVKLSLLNNATALTEVKTPDFIIQCYNILPPNFLADGIGVEIYTESFKGTGKLANLKNNNYLLHSLALRKALAQGAQEAIILNTHRRVCESALANIFWVDGGTVFTPPLSEGCVSGTIRRLLVEHAINGEAIKEMPLNPEQLVDAEEVFLTNAIKWVTPVAQIGDHKFHIHRAEAAFRTIAGLLDSQG